jgi:hypothetical protein
VLLLLLLLLLLHVTHAADNIHPGEELFME